MPKFARNPVEGSVACAENLATGTACLPKGTYREILHTRLRTQQRHNMLATTHLAQAPGHGRSAFADAPKLPSVSRPRLAVNNSASISAPLAPIREEASIQLPKGIDKIKAITSGVGFMIGDILAQKITGGDGLDAFRSFKLGAIGAGLDIFRQDWAGKGEEVKDGRLAQAAKAVTAQASWGPIVACGMYAAIKVAEGNPGEIVQGVEDKMAALLVANTLLWPMARFLNDKFVPEEHRVTANHIMTVVWSAWLSTLGHAPMVDPTDFFQSTGMDQAAEGVSQAISHAAATPFGAHAVAAVSGAAKGVVDLAERLPSCLLEKAFSKSLDVLSPLAAVERSPSQLLENALSLPRAGTLDLVLERFGSHRL